MSYGAPQKRRAAGGGGLVFLIILGIGGYLLFSNLMAGPAPDGGILQPSTEQGSSVERTENERQRELDNMIGNEPLPPKKRAAEGWDMTDVDIDNPTKDPAAGSAQSKTTQSGDWEMSEVDGENKGTGIRFGESKPQSDPTKTKKGDWEMEEVKEKGGN